jgi:hypothetical protein
MTCKLLLLLAPGGLLAQESVWRNVAALPYTPVRPETVRLSRSRLSAIGKLLQNGQRSSLPWDCFGGATYRRVSSAMLYSNDDVGQQRMAEARKRCEAAHKQCILLVRKVW